MSIKLPKQFKRWCEKANVTILFPMFRGKSKLNWFTLTDSGDNEYHITVSNENVLKVYIIAFDGKDYQTDLPLTEASFLEMVKNIKGSSERGSYVK